jgi:3D (Asp-Asp-Asp) domain-containing protein
MVENHLFMKNFQAPIAFLFGFSFSFMFLTESLAQSLHPTPFDTVKVITYKINGKTASGKRTYKIKEPFLAVSRDLLTKYPLHSMIELSDCKWSGKYKVLDIMGKNHVSTVDIFYTGKKKNMVKCVCKPFEKARIKT